MKRNKIIFACSLILLFFTLTAFTTIKPPIQLIINGKEIKTDVPAQLISDRVMVPVRWVAEALGADVRWNQRVVYVNSKFLPSITKETVIDLLKSQGKNKNKYFFAGLQYELVDLDGDNELEIVVKIDESVHFGNFFIFAKDNQGKYKLKVEKDWRVEGWNFNNFVEVDNKKIYEIITKAADSYSIHLIYFVDGGFHEAWQGTKWEMVANNGGKNYKKIGSYQIDKETESLYAWETFLELVSENEYKTEMKVFDFNGKKFIR